MIKQQMEVVWLKTCARCGTSGSPVEGRELTKSINFVIIQGGLFGITPDERM
jgi:hypothetical protein